MTLSKMSVTLLIVAGLLLAACQPAAAPATQPRSRLKRHRQRTARQLKHPSRKPPSLLPAERDNN